MKLISNKNQIKEAQLEILKELYYDPKTGFVNLNNLLRLAKEYDLNELSTKDISNFYKNQSITQIYHKKQKQHYTPIKALSDSVGYLQVDLMFLKQFSKHNKNPAYKRSFKYLLTVIDIHSRYAWVFPLIDKSSSEVSKNLKQVFREIKQIYPKNEIVLTTNDGTEFKGKTKLLCKKHNITQFMLNPNDSKSLTKKGIIERFNRTLWGYIKKYTSSKGTLKYYDVLPALVNNYNNTFHRTIKHKPIEIFYDKQIPDEIKYQDKINEKYKVNSKVRILMKKKLFDKKSFEPVYSTNVYEITKIFEKKIYLKNINTGKTLINYYLPQQLLLINEYQDLTKYNKVKQSTKKVNKIK